MFSLSKVLVLWGKGTDKFYEEICTALSSNRLQTVYRRADHVFRHVFDDRSCLLSCVTAEAYSQHFMTDSEHTNMSRSTDRSASALKLSRSLERILYFQSLHLVDVCCQAETLRCYQSYKPSIWVPYATQFVSKTWKIIIAKAGIESHFFRAPIFRLR